MSVSREQLNNLPLLSGVYIYRDAEGSILYVGKAKVLRHRVKQYFAPNIDNAKVAALVGHIETLEYVVTPSEADAFLLENNLIKKHKPPYNILLKDDKQYSYIKISINEDFPRLVLTRKLEKDNCKYFGPYTSSGKQLLELIQSLYPTATCNKDFSRLPSNFRPCLNSHINFCPAPCIGKITKEQYGEVISNIIQLLSGKTAHSSALLREQMQNYSLHMEYEKALECKQKLQLLESFDSGKVASLNKNIDCDVLTVTSNGYTTVCNNMLIRKGKVILSHSFDCNDGAIEMEQTLSSLLVAHYENLQPSREILLNYPLSDGEEIQTYLKQKHAVATKILCPQRGIKRKLVEMSLTNAQEFLLKNKEKGDRVYNRTVGAVHQLQQLLGLKNLPNRIECYDISNISGVDKVASMVVATRGVADTKQYRRFRIETVEGADDFACMKEVLTRRFERIKQKDEKFGQKPDLIVIDGGKGQLSSVLDVYGKSGVEGIEIISLAKKEEIVFCEAHGEGVRLPRNSFALSLLVATRDEAHRFAITYFRQLHGKNSLKSVLSDIEGVGKKRQVELVRHFGSVSKISSASVEEIAAVPSINLKVAEAIYNFFHN